MDDTFSRFEHDSFRPRQAEALQMLHKIVLRVWPIMRKRRWRVGTLAEFWPDERNLLGINEGFGRTIRLRLRHWDDERHFLPLEFVIDVLLHELAHIVHANHDALFDALLDQARNEYTRLEHDEDVLMYEAAQSRPRQEEALCMLRKVASRVRPSLRRRGWTVGILAELWPSDRSACRGRNVNRGQKISLRLRHRNDHSRFLPLEDVLDTMLHQLCHMNNGNPNVLLEQLRTEQNQLRAAEMTSNETRNHAVDENRPRPRNRTQQNHADKDADEEAIMLAYIDMIREEEEETRPSGSGHHGLGRRGESQAPWACNICTLVNPATQLRCNACGIQRS